MFTPDLIIVGGGLAGCIAACEAADRGLSPIIIEKRPYLGREVSAYNHTFIRCSANDDALRRCPDEFRELFSLHASGEIIAPEGRTRQLLLQVLEDHNIPVLFEAEPVAVSVVDKRTTGLLLACPLGLTWIAGGSIVDATELQNVARMDEGDARLPADGSVVHSVFELTFRSDRDALAAFEALDELFEDSKHVSTVAKSFIDDLGLCAGSAHLHPSIRNDTLIVEYGFNVPEDLQNDRFAGRSRLEDTAREKGLSLASHLREKVRGFESASLSHRAFECHVSCDREANVDGENDGHASGAQIITLPVLSWGFTLDDVADHASAIGRIVSSIPTNCKVNRLPQSGELIGSGIRIDMAELDFAPLDDEAMPVQLFLCTQIDQLRSVATYQTDVCVAGAGAAGGMAMIAAAEEGCSVIALEVNHELGGTHTTGRVVGYYAGYRDGASGAAVAAAAEMKPAVIASASPGGMPHAEYLRRRSEQNGVSVFTGTRVCGVKVENGVVKAVYAANEHGLFVVEARVTVDATGDGDVAAFTGAEYQIGDDRDGMVQSYSMWGAEVYPTPSFLAQRYLSDPGVFHPDVYSERLRAIRVAQRKNSPFHISPMVTPRESRRITGEYYLTLNDVLHDRVHDDVVTVAVTQADSHAFTSSDLNRFGGIGGGVPLNVRIPHGCFVPKELDGLLVAAKAISGERDATSFCRMNADIKNAGYAIGIAAAMAAKTDGHTRAIDITALQRKLKSLGILPEWAFGPETQAGNQVTSDDAEMADEETLVESLSSGSFGTLSAVIEGDAERLLPLLEKRYETTAAATSEATYGLDRCRSEQALLCMALAWHGSLLGADHLSELLEGAVNDGRHLTPPRRRAFRGGVVRGGYGSDDYSVVNRLIACAGRSPSPDVIAPLARLVSDAPGLVDSEDNKPMPYDQSREDIVAESWYFRLRNIAFAVERKAAASLVLPIETLLRRPGVTGYSVAIGDRETPQFMRAHLEVWLARAALRCGSLVGAEILITYLRDTHVFFRRHAKAELLAVVGTDWGDVAEWKTWLKTNPTLQPVPYEANRS